MQRPKKATTVHPGNVPLTVGQYASIVAALYRGPFQQRPWEDFLADLQALFWPCLTVIGLRLPTPGDTGISYVGGADFSSQNQLNFANKYAALAPLIGLPDGKTVALDDLISREQLRKTTYYQKFMKPYNQEQVMGFDLHRSGRLALFLRVVRGHGEPDFNTRDRDVLELIKIQCRELAVWLENSRNLSREQHLHEQAFSRLALGTVILDANLCIVYQNSIAEQLLKTNVGVANVSGKFRVMHHGTHRDLHKAISTMLADKAQGIPWVIPIARQAEQPPLFLTMRRLPLQNRLDDSRHIALYMTDPELRQLDQTQPVMDAFGLTPQEARLVIALANGGTLDEFASETGVSKNTARTHLYASFRKVGVSQQSSLVSHVIRTIYGL